MYSNIVFYYYLRQILSFYCYIFKSDHRTFYLKLIIKMHKMFILNVILGFYFYQMIETFRLIYAFFNNILDIPKIQLFNHYWYLIQERRVIKYLW